MSKIIVSNLPINFTVEDIRSIFSKYGKIFNIFKSEKNYFISYKSREECSKAINAMNNKKLKNMILIVDYAYDRDNKIFVFNLPLNCDLVDVSDFFSYYGKIEYCKFIKNVLMIEMENKKDAQKLLDLNNKISYGDKLVSIRNTMKNEVSEGKRSVFVYNIPEEITEMDFLHIFSKYGNVLSSGIKDKRGFVNYEKEVGAYKAAKYMDGVKLKNMKIRVVLKENKKPQN